jgi:hypothetical protein
MRRKKKERKARKTAARKKEILNSFKDANLNVSALALWRPVCLDGHGHLGSCMPATAADNIANSHRLETGHMTDKESC